MLNQTLIVILVCSTASLSVMVILSIRLRSPQGVEPREQLTLHPVALTGLPVVVLISWAGRIALLSGSGSFFSRAVLPFGTPASCLFLLLYRGQKTRPIAVAVLALEALWAVLFASKTPVLAVALTLALRLSGKPGALRRASPWLILSVLATFLVIQPLKGIDTADHAAQFGGPALGPVGGVAYSVIERFDGANAIVDALSGFPRGGWMTPSGFLDRLLSAATPTFGQADTEATLGQIWTREVRTRSVPYQYQDVPLAFGPIAEGYAVGQLLGAVSFSVIYTCLTIWTVQKLCAGNAFWIGFSAFLVLGGGLMEHALLGYGYATVKSVQLGLLVFLADYALRHRQVAKSVSHSKPLSAFDGGGR